MHHRGDHFIQTQNYQMFIHTIRYSVSAFPTGQMQTKQNKTQSGQQKKKGGGGGRRGVGGLKLRKLVKKKKLRPECQTAS